MIKLVILILFCILIFPTEGITKKKYFSIWNWILSFENSGFTALTGSGPQPDGLKRPQISPTRSGLIPYKLCEVYHVYNWVILSTTRSFGNIIVLPLRSCFLIHKKILSGMSTYSNAHAKVKKWIFNYELPRNWFEFGIILNNSSSSSILDI